MALQSNSLRICTDVSEAEWLKSSLAPWVPLPETNSFPVGTVIPDGFDNYVLVRHIGQGDSHGNLGSQTLNRLVEVLTKFTLTPTECFIALWEGQGWMHSGSIGAFSSERPPERVRGRHRRFNWSRSNQISRVAQGDYGKSLDHLESCTLPGGIMRAPRLELTNRRYLYMYGAIDDASKIEYTFNGYSVTQSPNLMWPKDRNWVMASEIDLNGTFIAGELNLITHLLKDEHLEVESVSRHDAITKLNIA